MYFCTCMRKYPTYHKASTASYCYIDIRHGDVEIFGGFFLDVENLMYYGIGRRADSFALYEQPQS